jgi:O-antigen ligase
MIYFLLAETINNEKKIKTMLGVIFFSIVLVSTDGIFQFMTGADFLRNYTMDTYNIVGNRVRASFGNPNSFAGWLLVMIPIVLSLAYSEAKIAIKSLLLIMTGLLMFCLVLTYSRGGWIGVILALFFLCFFRSKKLLITLNLLILILLFAIPDSVEKRVISAVEITEKAAIDRKILWQEASNIIKDYPLIGCGFNTYATVGPRYRLDSSTGCYPHNSYLHMAAETGLLGLGAFIWIMVALYKTSLANLKTINDKFYNALLLGLLAGLSGFLLHSLVDTNIYALQLGNLMWFIMGLIVAVQRVALSRS